MDSGRSFTPQPKASARAQRDLNGAVGVVALSDVHQARQAADRAEVKVVEAVFAAGQRQHYGIGGRLLDKFRVVIAAGTCAVAAADQEEMPDRAGLHSLNDLIRHAQHRAVAQSRS